MNINYINKIIIYYPIHFMIQQFLNKIYRYGPMFNILNMQIGFWNGLPLESICSMISGQTQIFWLNNINECKKMVQNKQN